MAELTETLNLKLRPCDAARVRRLAERLPLRRGQLMREALLLGLRAIEADPASLLRPTKPQAKEATA